SCSSAVGNPVDAGLAASLGAAGCGLDGASARWFNCLSCAAAGAGAGGGAAATGFFFEQAPPRSANDAQAANAKTRDRNIESFLLFSCIHYSRLRFLSRGYTILRRMLSSSLATRRTTLSR